MERKAFKLLHDAESSWWYRARANVVERVLSRYGTSNETILDLGAGFGGMHDSLEKYGVVDAFEPDSEAQEVATGRGYRVVHTSSDLSKLPSNPYSFIAIFDVLEHTEDDDAFLKTLHTMMTEDGALIITVPAFPFLWSDHDVTHHHYRRYTKKSLKRVLEQNGFSLLYVSYWNMLLFLPAALVRLLGSSGESSLSMPSYLNTMIKHMVVTETRLIPKLSIPFGTGIVAYAKKTKLGQTRKEKGGSRVRKLLVMPIKMTLGALPGNAPMYIYATLLRPRPLRALANYILRRLIPKELELPEGILLLNQNDPVVSGALALDAYEAFFSEAFRKQLKSDMTVVDIGANLGYYTLIASKRGKKVIAFEPENDNAALLTATLLRNQCDNVTLVKKGLGDKQESRTLAIHPDNKGKHTLLGIDEKGVTTANIPVTTLDLALKEIGSPKIDLMKIDIEGWEAKALRGAKETIQAHHPIIMFEFAPHRISAAGDDPLLMLHELEDEEYTLFVVDEDHDTLLPLDPQKLLSSLSRSDAYVNILAEPRAT